MTAKRQELFDLIKGENPDWNHIQGKIKEISVQQSRLEEEVARFLLECKKHLRPEQQAAFVNLVERRLCRPRGDGCGPGRGQRGPPWRHGQGLGPGPAPPPPPKSP
jgi:Spy/CpxP family protein refolding chaperone